MSSADAAFAAGEQRDRVRRERLSSQDAKAQRTRSQTAYRGLGGDEALALGREMFSEQLTGRLFDGARPAPGVRVVDQRGDGAALVEDTQTGRRSLLMSTLPLQAKRPDGAFAPVDLSLENSAAGSVGPKNSRAPFRVASLSAASVSFPGTGVSFSVRGGARRTAQIASDRAFFANVLQDTDVGVMPLPDGAELFVLVRSPQAPERFVLDVQLPDGARLRQAVSKKPIPNDPPKSLEIVHGTQSVGYIHPPVAIDADGQPVPATISLDGQSIVLDVSHRDRDVRYPLNVDPELRLYSDYSAGWLRWGWGQARYGANDGYFGAAANDCAYYCGLYQSVPTNTTLTNGSYANWYYRAPVNTYVYRTSFGGIAHSPIEWPAGYNHTRTFQGLMQASAVAWETNVNYVNQAGISGPNPFGPSSGAYWGLTHDFCFNPRCDPKQPAATEQNYALFGLQAQNAFGCCTINSGTLKATNTMAWAEVYLGDRRPPVLTTATPASRDWTDEPAGTQHTIGVGVHDDGLGIYGIGLDGAASGGGFVRHGCFGHIDHGPCPPDWSRNITYTLNEGANTLTAYGQDFVDNRTAGGTWTEKIDRSPPSITELSGSLHAARDRDDDRRFMGLYNDAYALRVRASDAHSGVREIEIYVDNQSQRSRGGYTAGGALDWTLRPDDYSDGKHSIEVVIRDNIAGHAGAADDRHVVRRAFSVTVDRRGDIYQADHVIDDPANGGALIAQEWVRINSKTARREGPDRVVTRTDVPCREGDPSSPVCPEARYRTLDSQLESANPDDKDSFIRTRGAYADDPNIEQISDLLEPSAFASGGLVALASGPLTAALQPWQVAPPAHGDTYDVYERTGSTDVNDEPYDETTGENPESTTKTQYAIRLWVERTTRMPIRQTVTSASGTDTSYWTYDVSRAETSEVPADFFLVGAPADAGMEQQNEYTANRAIGRTTDRQTGTQFTPYYLGSSFFLDGATACFGTATQMRHLEPTPNDALSQDAEATKRDLSDLTRITATYELLPLGTTCLGGQGASTDPELTVVSVAQSSQLAAAYRDAIVPTAEAMQIDLTGGGVLSGGLSPFVFGTEAKKAYVVPGDEHGTVALADVGDTTVMITGRFNKLDAPMLFSKLETR